MANNQILTDDEIYEGYILSCQARPTSDEVEVNYDEV
jgi:ring-1,2-phenylacetyl-CoA epoxidase subunit PaaE